MLLALEFFGPGPLEWVLLVSVPFIYCCLKGFRDGATYVYAPVKSFHPIAVLLALCLPEALIGFAFPPLLFPALYQAALLLLIGWPMCFISYWLALQYAWRFAPKKTK